MNATTFLIMGSGVLLVVIIAGPLARRSSAWDSIFYFGRSIAGGVALLITAYLAIAIHAQNERLADTVRPTIPCRDERTRFLTAFDLLIGGDPAHPPVDIAIGDDPAHPRSEVRIAALRTYRAALEACTRAHPTYDPPQPWPPSKSTVEEVPDGGRGAGGVQ